MPPLVSSLDPHDYYLFTALSRFSTRDLEALTLAERRAGFDVPVIHQTQAGDHLMRIGEKLLELLDKRSLTRVKPVVVTMDGTRVLGHTVVEALIFATDGTTILGAIAQGPTERADVYTDVLQRLHRSGLDTRGVLWLVDGHKAGIAAIKAFAGPDALIQRCLNHKVRNLLEPRNENLRVADLVAIGRRLVDEHVRATGPGDGVLLPERSPRVAPRLLDELQAAIAGRPSPADGKHRSEEECLRRIAYRVIHRELYLGWDESDYQRARFRLDAVGEWLEDWGYLSAARSLREGLEETLTLQRLHITDLELRRVLRTTNGAEAWNYLVSRQKQRSTRDQHPTQRERIAVMAQARAEERATPVAQRSELEYVSLRLAMAGHSDVVIDARTGSPPGTVHVTRLELAAGGDAGALGAVLDDLAGWADRNEQTIVLPVALTASLPEAGMLGLTRNGFDRRSSDGAALVRVARVRSASAALSMVREAVGDDHRLLVAIAERALELAPGMIQRSKIEQLEQEAGGLTAACHELRGLRDEVRAWWDGNWREAAGEAALAWASAKLERAEPPRPLAGGRSWVLEQRQVDWLVGAASARKAQLERSDLPMLTGLRERSPRVLSGLDAAVERIERAARVVAAAHVLELHERTAGARARVARDSAVVPARGEASVPPPISRNGRALGERRTGILSAYAAAIAPMLTDLSDGALVQLRRELGDPWEALDREAAQVTRELAAEHLALFTEYRTARRSQGQYHARAQDPEQSAAIVKALERTGAAYGRTARTVWSDLARVGARLEAQRAAARSPDAFVVEQPLAALHHAVHVECERRGLGLGTEAQEPTRPRVRARRRSAAPAAEIGPSR